MLLFIIQLVINRAAATDKTCFRAPLCWHLYVVKELIHAFSLTYIELWMHLGSLESNRDVPTLGWLRGKRLISLSSRSRSLFTRLAPTLAPATQAGSYYICYRTEG